MDETRVSSPISHATAREFVPIAYRIDPERQLVLTRAWGVLTDRDILGHKENLVRDAAFDPQMRQLSDIRAIERLDVTVAGVRAMVAHDAANAQRRTGHRMAFVVATDEVYGMARMYDLMGDSQQNDVAVFRTLEEAEAWLASD